MATTVEKAQLKILIQETVTLNGTEKGGKQTHTINSIKHVDERILSVPTYETAILHLSGASGAGTYQTSKVKYIRMTNLDDSNFVRLSFISGSDGSRFDVKLDPKRSMVFTNASISGTSAGVSFGEFANFTKVNATSDTSSCDVSLFVATT
tara:strand:- start:4593 stop:5045 length:453 start_codon:yes stop_codon:yes gene_type:complete